MFEVLFVFGRHRRRNLLLGHLHRAAEFLAQIAKSMPRVASGLAGSKFGATHVWASSQSSSFPTEQKINCTQTHGGKTASVPKTSGGKISQIQLSMIPRQCSASINRYTKKLLLANSILKY
jgi:hypothetical protein